MEMTPREILEAISGDEGLREILGDLARYVSPEAEDDATIKADVRIGRDDSGPYVLATFEGTLADVELKLRVK